VRASIVIGQIVWHVHGRNPPKLRPGVVIDIVDGVAVVVFGTSVVRAREPAIAEQPADRAGKRMGLKVKTYFYQTDRARVRIDQLQDGGRRFMATQRLWVLLAV
jgi:hypothetical protein